MNNGSDDSWRSDRYIWGLGGRDAGSGSAEAFRTPKGEPPDRKGQLMAEEQRKSILRYFRYDHLPEDLQMISKPFYDLAMSMDFRLLPGTEKSVTFRKLLEAKDAAVRAALDSREE